MIEVGDDRQNMRSFRHLSSVLNQVLSPKHQAHMIRGVVEDLTANDKLLAKVGGNHDEEFDQRIFGEALQGYLLEKMKAPRFKNRGLVYLTVGDPYLYSTWIYLNRELSIKHPEIKITVIPGIVSMFTFASKVGISLAEGAEKMAVIPSCYDLTTVKEIAKNCDTMIFLKDGRYFDQVIDLIREAGFSTDSICAIGQDLGTDHEIVRKLTLGEVTQDTLTSKYFSIMVIKRV